MQQIVDSSFLLAAILPAVAIGALLATVITYLVNRRRQTAGMARATLFLAIWGLTTVIPLLLAIPIGHLAMRQIKRSGGALKGKGQAGFGLVCGYGVLVMAGIQLWLGVGDMVHAHQTSLNASQNANAIEHAKSAWATANNKKPGDLPTASDLAPFMPNGQCPPPSFGGETYQINPIGTKASWVWPPRQL